MNRSFILSVFAFVFAVISGGCDSAKKSDNQVPSLGISKAENSDYQARRGNAIYLFGEENVERYEKAFQTGTFDFLSNNDNDILYYAVCMGRLDWVILLSDKGMDINAIDQYRQTVLHYAAQSGNLELVQWLVEKGAKLNAKIEYGTTVLHYAAQSGNLEMVKFFVKKGLDVNAKTDCGWTVLFLATQSKNQELIDWLKAHGAKD